MADLFALLVQSGNSLGAHSSSLAAAGHNIANANTPGFTRQTVELVANPGSGAGGGTLGIGRGVSVGAVTQARDAFVERQIPQLLASSGRSQAESDALQGMSALNPDLPGGLSTTLGAFYSSLRTLAQNPGDLALRQNVVSRSENLARSFSQTVGTIEATRDGIDAQMQGNLNVINSTARALAELNINIQTARTAGGQVNDLLDARRAAADTLARLTGTTPYDNEGGDTLLALPGGMALVTGNAAAQLSAVPDSTNGGHLRLRITKADGAGPYDVPTAGIGGQVGGLLDARDGALRTAVDAVDDFAFDLATSMNTLHFAAYAMDGSTARNLFTIPTTAPGAAAQMTVNAAVAADPRLLAAATTLPAAPGDGRNVLAMIGTESQLLASGNDPVTTLQKITSDFGTTAARAKATSQHDSTLATHLIELRNSTAGVSIDEEMINLTKAQKAYEALSKVISTADQMLDSLLKIR